MNALCYTMFRDGEIRSSKPTQFDLWDSLFGRIPLRNSPIGKRPLKPVGGLRSGRSMDRSRILNRPRKKLSNRKIHEIVRCAAQEGVLGEFEGV